MIIMSKKLVIFLDIDGVLQSYHANQRFIVNRKALVDKLSQELEIDYHQYNEFDVAAIYYDWHPQAISLLKSIIDETNAYIVISSNWRNPSLPNKMNDLLKIHALDKYYLGDTPQITNILNYQDKLKVYPSRVVEILTYLEEHPDITNYVVVDDLDLSQGLTNHFVKTNNLINKEDANTCIKILKRKL